MKNKIFRRNNLLEVLFVLIIICSQLLIPKQSFATHAATTLGEIENRPSPVFRRECIAGTNAGNYCKMNSECPGSSCTDRNVYNLTVAVMFNASAAQLTAIQNLFTNMSAFLFDTTDGQAEVGTVTIHNDALTANQADLNIQPASNDTWWNADSGHYRNNGKMNISINYITSPSAGFNNAAALAHEFSHLVFDVRDEYESRPGCGATTGGANCPISGSGAPTCLMDNNGSEYCWGQGDSANITDLSSGDHDATNVTEQSACRDNRSCWSQLAWSWPSTIQPPTGAPDPNANGATVNPPNFIITNDAVRVVLVLDESGSMGLDSPSRIERLKVAANDFVSTAENGTELGIVSYSSTANPDVAIAALTNNRNTWTNAVTGLAASGATNIGDGLIKAKEMIVDAGGVTANTYVVLMTDGINNRPSPQSTADSDLQEKVDDLLASGIPVYVTCTGGDLGLQSQCSEIANGTNGFNSDSADAGKLPENFVDFHERITGFQSVDSVYGNFKKIKSFSPKTIYIDKGSEAASFSVLWRNKDARASVIVKDPDGVVHQTRNIPQGAYVRIKNPKAGDWKIIIDPLGSTESEFVARGYTHNRINSFTASTRKPSVLPNEEIYVYGIVRSEGGSITSKDSKITAVVTLPDGSKDTVELFDKGRDATGHGDDLPNDGIFTGIYTNTSQKGAYGFHFDLEVDNWVLGEELHQRDDKKRSPRFMREVRVSAAVGDPNDVVDDPEDDVETGNPGKDKPTVIQIIILIILIFILILILRCCCKKRIG